MDLCDETMHLNIMIPDELGEGSVSWSGPVGEITDEMRAVSTVVCVVFCTYAVVSTTIETDLYYMFVLMSGYCRSACHPSIVTLHPMIYCQSFSSPIATVARVRLVTTHS